MTKLKIIPHDIETEKAVLGCILIDNEAAANIINGIDENYFFAEKNKFIFKASKDIFYGGANVDILSVFNTLDKNGTAKQIGGMEYLTQLINIPSAANYGTYVSLLEKDYISRQLIKIGSEISEIGYDRKAESADIAEAQKKIHKLATCKNSGELVHIADEAAKYITDVENWQRGKKEENIIKSGYKNIDSIIFGFKPSTYTLIAARPSIGKTAFALSIASNAALNQNKKVAVFNMEMSKREIVSRLITNTANIPYSKQKRESGLHPSQMQELTNAYIKFVNSQLYIDDSADNTPMSIMSKSRKLASSGDLDLVIIDYLGLMTMGNRGENRQQEVSDMSRAMKIFSKELDIPVIVLAQLNRGGELRGGKPELIDLRESGAIEQDADIVMFLQRYKYNGKGAREYPQENVIELYVEKNRNGQRGKAAFEFVGDTQQFVPIMAKQS